MTHRRRPHLLIALLAVAALWFAQCALAGYACPAQASPESMMRMSMSGHPCAGMDPAQPALCHQHAVGEAWSADVAKLPVASAPALWIEFVVPAVAPAEPDPAVPRGRAPEVRPPPDPLFLETLRLRV